jgi:hypothetical protein
MFWKPLQTRNKALPGLLIARFIGVSEQLWRNVGLVTLALLLLMAARQSIGTDDPATPPNDPPASADDAPAVADESEALSDDPSPPDDESAEPEGDLDLLRRFYTTPRDPQESNYFIDLWEGENLRTVTSIHGLTNNRTLFVNSHGKRTADGGYALYPHQSLLSKDRSVPYYSMADLAGIMGKSAVSNINNIVLSACNTEGALNAKEIRKSFPNATNIVHCAAGELGYQAMFFQALVNHSSKVKPIYEWAERNDRGEIQYLTAPVPNRNAKRFAPYVAELYTPNGTKPFSVQRAGRELLDPERFGNMASAK